MPIGSFTVVPYIARELATRPRGRVLDLGMGSGFYGAVVRQWADHGVRPWRTLLVGVEAWADYRNPLWDLYDLIVVDTIQHYLTRAEDRFDIVLLGDVLEHHDTSEGTGLLSQAQDRVAPGGTLFVSSPAVFFDQPAVYGNERERHRSLWSAAELEALGFRTILTGAEPQVACVPTLLASWTREHH
jgi:predicted TPR repeat methyltransferase